MCDARVSSALSTNLRADYKCMVSDKLSKDSVEDMQILEKPDLNISRLHRAA